MTSSKVTVGGLSLISAPQYLKLCLVSCMADNELGEYILDMFRLSDIMLKPIGEELPRVMALMALVGP